MFRSLSISSIFAYCLLVSSAFGESVCFTNGTDQPVWMTLVQRDAMHWGKLLSPNEEMCSRFQVKQFLFVSVSAHTGDVSKCQHAFEPGVWNDLSLKKLDAQYGCTWAKTQAVKEAMVMKKTRAIFCTSYATKHHLC